MGPWAPLDSYVGEAGPGRGPSFKRRLRDMTDDFDFDFDVDRGRSASRTENRDTEKEAPGNGNSRELPELDYGEANGGDGADDRSRRPRGNGNGNGRGNGSRRFAPPAPAEPGVPDEGDWLSIGDDDFSPGARSPLRERDDGPAGPPTPGEARNSAKEARRRASRRPSPILYPREEEERTEGEGCAG